MRDYQLTVEEPTMDGAGWWFAVTGLTARRHGPFATEDDARAARHRLFVRLDTRARERGGWAWKSTHDRWRITVPNDVVVRAEPLASAPCAVHAPLPDTKAG
ncbi:MAG: hypothetical protein H6737_02710 [Alphaproteobacteria bacterium]|nr:hypothetical protein [Alphaproteobacteria bacterium]